LNVTEFFKNVLKRKAQQQKQTKQNTLEKFSTTTMVEVHSGSYGFEVMRDAPYQTTLSTMPVQQDKNPMKFGSSYGVSRKVIANKVWWSAKLPAMHSMTGTSVKLGMFSTAAEASEAVQFALLNPGEYHENSADKRKVPVTEVLEASFCERVETTKRSNREKLARKKKALAKKNTQRNSQVSEGEYFIRCIDEAFDDLKRINSYSRFARSLDTSVSHLMENFFPRNGDIDVANNKQGASQFCRDALTSMWNTEQCISQENELVSSVSDFINLSSEEGNKYGQWVQDKVYN